MHHDREPHCCHRDPVDGATRTSDSTLARKRRPWWPGRMTSRQMHSLATLMTLVLVLALMLASHGTAAPLQNATHAQIAHAVKYFIQYGHTNHTKLIKADKSAALKILSDDIRKFQKFAGLNETGDLDSATRAKLDEPRCGVRDDEGRSVRKTGHRRKRWALHGSRWKTRTLNYSIENGPTSLQSQNASDDLLEDALNTWAREANIQFRKVPTGQKGTHIKIKFALGEHGDGDPFDDKGGTLAHAFFPLYGGAAHFDDAEPWSINSKRGSNLYVAATHEFGHSLGLAHSRVDSMMSPWYQRPEDPKSRSLLAKDDIDAIQILYGKRSPMKPRPRVKKPGPEILPRGSEGQQKRSQTPTFQQPIYPETLYPTENRPGYYPVPVPTPAPRRPNTFNWSDFGFNFGGNLYSSNIRQKEPDDTKANGDAVLCADSRLDAALLDVDTMYVLQGHLYWRLTDAGVHVTYPRNISAGWGGVPSPLDAAFFHNRTGKIYMFKGDRVWRFTDDYTIEVGFPRLISVEFPGMADRDLSAAFQWGQDNLVYMVRGSQYWREGSPGPRPLTDWAGLPPTVDAAVRYTDGKTYFFSGQHYYRYDDANNRVDTSDDGPYPRDTGTSWFKCKRHS